MKVLSIFGVTKSGKTTVLENIIGELRKRGYSVASVKDIHFETFAIDTPGTNTDRHKQAGSQLVTARGLNETDILFPHRLSIDEILGFYHHDFVLLEGVDDYNVPKIITAHHRQEVDERLDDSVFAISGVLAEHMEEYRALPVIHALNQTAALVDLIEEKVPRLLPDFPPECCSACGLSCRQLLAAILQSKRRRCDCVLDRAQVTLTVGGRDIAMVPFVQQVLKNTLLGLISTLDGYKEHAQITITMGGEKRCTNE